MKKRDTPKGTFKNLFGDDFADEFYQPTPATTAPTTSTTSGTKDHWLADNIFDTINALGPSIIQGVTKTPQQYPAGTYPYGTVGYNPNLPAAYPAPAKDNTGVIIAVVGGVLLIGTVITVVVLSSKKK